MKTEEFNYEIDKNLIAQKPSLKRGESKLLILDKNTGKIKHKNFSEIINYLNQGDAIVFNDTKVIPARIIGIKEKTQARIEFLLLDNIKENYWSALAKPQKRLKIGNIIFFDEGILKAKICDINEKGLVKIKLIYDGDLMQILNNIGKMPLPPYINESLEDKNRYQTIYAKKYGSSAAPTAGLHFTDELINKLKKKCIKVVYVTLHVGLGTFRPVETLNIKDHKMHSESLEMSSIAAKTLNEVKSKSGKIIAVGTTSVRVLETAISENGLFKPMKKSTNLFIYPGYKFKAVDKIITNFHLPKSTLLMLVSAFSSKKLIEKAYKEAISNKYLFFSFGDAMLIK